MHALTINNGKLTHGTLPDPQPMAGEVLIAVRYIGVNRADAMQVAGSYKAPEDASPLPGLEVSGTICAMGSGVTGWRVGDAVCALLNGGGYAELAIAPAAQCLPIPKGLSMKEAASLPEAAATAVMALMLEAHLQSGERVLIHGGASGVGLMMAQIARTLGAEVYATVGSEAKVSFLENLGITAVNHRAAPFAEQLKQRTDGVDVIIDILGAPYVETHFKLLRYGGRMVSLALMEGNILENTKISGFFLKNLRWSAATLRSKSPAQKAQIIEILRTQLWPKLASGLIQPVIDTVFPLADAEKALTRMQERLHLGKILLETRNLKSEI